MTATIATFEAVRTAVSDLRKARTTPTADAVITQLGGGSKSTVIAHLRTLRAEEMPEVELPPSVLDIVRPALVELFRAGGAAEMERSRARTERMDKLMDEMEAQIAELSLDNERLEGTVANLRVEHEKAAAGHAAALSTIADIERDLAACRVELRESRELAGTGLAEMMLQLQSSVAALGSAKAAGGRSERSTKGAAQKDDGLFGGNTDDNRK